MVGRRGGNREGGGRREGSTTAKDTGQRVEKMVD